MWRIVMNVMLILLLTWSVGLTGVSAAMKGKACKYDCEQYCQLRGEPAGNCYNGRCFCRPLPVVRSAKTGSSYSVNSSEIRRGGADVSFIDIEEPEKPCLHDCSKLCAAKGEAGGFCDDGRCQCVSHRHRLVLNDEQPFLDSSKIPCRQNCDDVCQLHGDQNGSCDGGRCVCRADKIKLMLKTAQENHTFLDSSKIPCRQNCTDVCQMHGDQDGSCDGGRCVCRSGKIKLVLKTAQKSHNVLNSSKLPCRQNCTDVCQLHGDEDGSCDGGRCVCRGGEIKLVSTTPA